MSIVSNPVYQAVLQELEGILSPRVVSRSLKEGLLQIGRTADDIDIVGIETILKGQIYRQLQVTMPVVQAKDAVTQIIDRLHTVAATSPPPESDEQPEVDRLTPALEQQASSIERLQESLKPYNLYFEWAEVQKLRAQIQLIEEAQEQGRDVPAVINEAETQLDIVSRMLEDHLVIQARELGELREALDQVRTLGGTKVRRLESLLGQIEEQQRRRQLAPAEVERARKLALDLRKLMESSVYSETVEAQQDEGEGGVLEVDSDEDGLLSIDTANLDPEVSARLLLLDLEGERHDLDALAQEHANLLDFEPELAARVTELRGRLDDDHSIEERLTELTGELGSATMRRREALLTELEMIEAQLSDLPEHIDSSDLRQSLQVAKGVLSTTLPPHSDIQQLRNLHRLAIEQSQELTRLEREAEGQLRVQLREQEELQARLEELLQRLPDSGDRDLTESLRQGLASLRAANDEQRSEPALVAELHRAEEAIELAAAERSGDIAARERSRLRALIGRAERLPFFEELADRTRSTAEELRRQLDGLDNGQLNAAQIEGLEALVVNLEAEVRSACERKLEKLAPLVAELGGDLPARLNDASDLLDSGSYPDLAQLEQLIAQQREARRSAQMEDLHSLERETRLYETVDTEANDRLKLLLGEIRAAIDAGRLTQDLEQGWRLLDHVKEIVDRRLADFEPRLDAAIEAFDAVAMLNSDDVAKARRTLTHLDSQRASMARVSISLRTQLENDLQEAETLIAQLQEEFEATRAIADQLVSGNVLDDVLNIFGGGEPVATSSEPEPAGDPLVALLNELSAERGVRGAVAVGTAGAIVAGDLSLDDAELRNALGDLEGRLGELGQSLALGTPQRITMERDDAVAIASWPLQGEGLLVVLDDPAVLSLVLHRLRREEDRLRTLLRAP